MEFIFDRLVIFSFDNLVLDHLDLLLIFQNIFGYFIDLNDNLVIYGLHDGTRNGLSHSLHQNQHRHLLFLTRSIHHQFLDLLGKMIQGDDHLYNLSFLPIY